MVLNKIRANRDCLKGRNKCYVKYCSTILAITLILTATNNLST